jgi:hypothetical protein
MVDEDNFRTEWHQITKDLQTWIGRGQGAICLEYASKHPKIFKADEYLAHVDFDKDTFIRLEKVSQCCSVE